MYQKTAYTLKSRIRFKFFQFHDGMVFSGFVRFLFARKGFTDLIRDVFVCVYVCDKNIKCFLCSRLYASWCVCVCVCHSSNNNNQRPQIWFRPLFFNDNIYKFYFHATHNHNKSYIKMKWQRIAHINMEAKSVIKCIDFSLRTFSHSSVWKISFISVKFRNPNHFGFYMPKLHEDNGGGGEGLRGRLECDDNHKTSGKY